MLEASGWLGCSTAKFERGEESKAKEIMAAVYEKIVADLVDMRSSTDESDVNYSRRATEAILTSFDVESLSYMADIAPSIQRLIPGTGRVSYDQLFPFFVHMIDMMCRFSYFSYQHSLLPLNIPFLS